jgi:hypothetical protein
MKNGGEKGREGGGRVGLVRKKQEEKRGKEKGKSRSSQTERTM